MKLVDWEDEMSRSFALLFALLGGGCGLISSDVLDFPLDIKPKTFSVDADNWMINQAEADAATSTSCAQAPSACAALAQQACAANCTATCSTTTQTCELQLQIGLYSTVDLNMDQSELASIDKTKGISVAIDSATYAVMENKLTVATPPMTIFVAPVLVMAPSDPMANPIGTLASIPALTTVDETAIAYTDHGKQDLNGAMTNFSSPFNLLVGASITLKAGDTVPSGKLTATVKVNAHAHAL